MKALIIIVLSTLVVSCPRDSKSEPLYGYDILGLAMQDIKIVKQEFAPNYALGTLAGTFGSPFEYQDELLATGKVSAWRTHLGNGTCKRNNNCGPGEFGPYDLKTLKKRAERYYALKLKYPGIPCFLSPYLEHDEKDKNLVNAWVALLRKTAPQCQVVISAFTGYVPPGVIIEKHGNTNTAAIVSNDGTSLFDANMTYDGGASQTEPRYRYRTNGSMIVFGWVNRCNLRVSGEKVFVPPLQRKAKLTRDNMQQITRLLKPVEGIPQSSMCPTPARIKDPELWKTNSEDYANGDVRGDRPLFITKKKVDSYSLHSMSGTKIGCTGSGSPYSGGGFRHYVGSCSGDSAVTLMNKSGSEWGLAKGGGSCYLVNFLRKQGIKR